MIPWTLMSVRAIRVDRGYRFEVCLCFDSKDKLSIEVSAAQLRSPRLFERAVLRQTDRPFDVAATIGLNPEHWYEDMERTWRIKINDMLGYTLP